MKNSRSPVRPHVVFAVLLFGLLLAACTRPAPTPQHIEPPGSTLSPYPPPPFVGTLPTIDPNFLLTAYPPPDTAIPTWTPTFGPSPTPSPTPTPFPTYPPLPTLIPTLDPTTLPDKLRAALTLQTEAGLNFHGVRRVTGWEYGFRSSGYCTDGPYRWLDESHLLLYPTTGQEEGMGISEFTLPVVMDLNDGSTWLPPTNGPTPGCDAPLWSEALQTLIATTAQEVTLLKPDGTVAQRFVGGVPLYIPSFLSPSGRRLLAGVIWRDLETGQEVTLAGRDIWGGEPVWTRDETRLFTCCYSFGDVKTGQYQSFTLGELHQIGRDGGVLRSRWALTDTRVIIEWDFEDSGKYGVLPLIDPVARTYQDVRLLGGLDPNLQCGFPSVAPDGNRLIVGCGTVSDFVPPESVGTFLIDLRTFIMQTIPAGWGCVNWSPDSQFILLARNYNSETQSSEYALLPVTGGNSYPVSEFPIRSPTWSPDGKLLAYLSEDGKALITLEPATRASYVVLLPQPSTNTIWSPHSDSLAVLAAGGLWWVPNPAYDHVEQITLPLPDVRDVYWAPSGHTLAFVSSAQVIVVAAAIAGP